MYRKRDGEEEGAQLWVGCDHCEGWSHYRCELENAREEVAGGLGQGGGEAGGGARGGGGAAGELEQQGLELEQPGRECALALVDGKDGGDDADGEGEGDDGGRSGGGSGEEGDIGGGEAVSCRDYRCPTCRQSQGPLPPPRPRASHASQTSVAAGAHVRGRRVVHHRPFLRTATNKRSGGAGGGDSEGEAAGGHPQSKAARAEGAAGGLGRLAGRLAGRGEEDEEDNGELGWGGRAKLSLSLHTGAAAPRGGSGKGLDHKKKQGSKAKKARPRKKAPGISKTKRPIEGDGDATRAGAHSGDGGCSYFGGGGPMSPGPWPGALHGRDPIDWTLMRRQRSSRALAAEVGAAAAAAAEVAAVSATPFAGGIGDAEGAGSGEGEGGEVGVCGKVHGDQADREGGGGTGATTMMSMPMYYDNHELAAAAAAASSLFSDGRVETKFRYTQTAKPKTLNLKPYILKLKI